MTYAVKEIFYTLQGEGANTGRAAVFCRFAGCNLWTGREQDRHDATCQFCDTDFVGTDGPGGGRFAAARELAAAVAAAWPPAEPGRRFVVCTGGEPLLQLDKGLLDALHVEGFEVAVETVDSLELEGTVLEADPPSGTMVIQGSIINLSVSSGTPPPPSPSPSPSPTPEPSPSPSPSV